MIRKGSTTVKVIDGFTCLDVFIDGIFTPLLQIDIRYRDKNVTIVEDWSDIEKISKHNGTIYRHGVECRVNEQIRASPLNKGEVIEINGYEDQIFVIFPRSSLER